MTVTSRITTSEVSVYKFLFGFCKKTAAPSSISAGKVINLVKVQNASLLS